MILPPPSFVLSARLDDASVEFMVRWLGGAAVRQNPFGVKIEHFGKSIAIAATARPEIEWMNQVFGLRSADAGRLGEILAFYDGFGITPGFEVIPEDGYPVLASALAGAGFVQTGFISVLYGVPKPLSVSTGVHVRLIGPDELYTYAAVHLAGHEVPEAVREDAALNLSHWADEPGWSLFLASLDGIPAAAGVLAVSGGIGALANASTIVAYRGRGAQSALLHARIAAAAEAGCELVFGQTTLGSQSERNMLRAGLRFGFPKITWSRPR